MPDPTQRGERATDAPALLSAAATTPLAAAIRERFRRPGPAVGRPRPPFIGHLAERSVRFSAATGRSLAVRRAVGVPASVRASGTGGASVRAPRWWRAETETEAPVGTTG
ncbi:MAG TPA: hypothetical protein VF413_08825, partial [Cellulomonas sp.]